MREDNLPTKAEIFGYWKDRFSALGIFIDWGEPGCWACGFHYDAKYDIKRSDAPWETILKCWDNIPLQRCHIVPKSLDGKDTVDNLFLLCRECHDLAPNSIYPEIFLEWVKHQSWYKREEARINQAMESYDLTEEEKERISTLIEDKIFREWVKGKFGIHWPQSKYASRSYRMTPSTIVGLAKYYIDTEQRSNTTLNTDLRVAALPLAG